MRREPQLLERLAGRQPTRRRRRRPLLGYKWDSSQGTYVQIPFQVDERFHALHLEPRFVRPRGPAGLRVRAVPRGADAQLSYVYDRDLYRFTANAAKRSVSRGAGSAYGRAAEPDPVKGLDDNDELAFMYRDAGPAARRMPRNPQASQRSSAFASTTRLRRARPLVTSTPPSRT